jgi:hypothetical protein
LRQRHKRRLLSVWRWYVEAKTKPFASVFVWKVPALVTALLTSFFRQVSKKLGLSEALAGSLTLVERDNKDQGLCDCLCHVCLLVDTFFPLSFLFFRTSFGRERASGRIAAAMADGQSRQKILSQVFRGGQRYTAQNGVETTQHNDESRDAGLDFGLVVEQQRTDAVSTDRSGPLRHVFFFFFFFFF